MMISFSSPNAAAAAQTTALAWLGRTLNRTLVLPIVVFFPTSRCNSRCVSCAWWKSSGADDLTLTEIDALAEALRGLGTRLVVFSGGEPLLRTDLFEVADLFRSRGIKLHLLTSGLALERHASEVAKRFDRVIVSLDSVDETAYQDIRGVDGLAAVERGVASMQALAPALPVLARSTLHRRNFRELPALVSKAREMRLTSISFLAADVSSDAFGRPTLDRPRSLLLSHHEVEEFRDVIELVIREQAEAFATRFIAESPARLRRLPDYYAAMLGEAPFPAVSCDAPWVAAVIQANGEVRPCYFHRPAGNIRQLPLRAIVTERLREFRAALNVGRDAVCERCVCSLNVNWKQPPWN